MTSHKWPLGTKYLTPGKHPRLCTVTDHLTVTNHAGDIVKKYYHSTHVFLGQVSTQKDVVETTISMGVALLESQDKSS